jgi:hypothetical protein
MSESSTGSSKTTLTSIYLRRDGCIKLIELTVASWSELWDLIYRYFKIRAGSEVYLTTQNGAFLTSNKRDFNSSWKSKKRKLSHWSGKILNVHEIH